MIVPPTSCKLATAVIELVLKPDRSPRDGLVLSRKGLEIVPG